MNNDLISRQAAIDDAHRQIWYRMNPSMKERIDKWLAELPSVTSEQEIGKWEKRIFPNGDPFFRTRFYCTACGGWNTYGETKFCPDCGAKMERKE